MLDEHVKQPKIPHARQFPVFVSVNPLAQVVQILELVQPIQLGTVQIEQLVVQRHVEFGELGGVGVKFSWHAQLLLVKMNVGRHWTQVKLFEQNAQYSTEQLVDKQVESLNTNP